MGFLDNQSFHRRAAAKQYRLLPEEETAKVKELIARFSPTFVWTATLTDSIPLPTFPDPAITTTAASNNNNGSSDSSLPISLTTPTSAPTKALTVNATTSTPVRNTNTIVAPTPDVKTTDASTTTSAVIVSDPVTASTFTTVVSTPSTTLPVAITLSPVPSVISITASSTISSAVASATQIGSSGSGTNVGGIVGGLVGGLLATAALIFVIRFLLNRRRKHNDEDDVEALNASNFRRSAILLEDPPAYDETVDRGFNPRPPTMIEHRLTSPPTYGAQYTPGSAVVPPTYAYSQ